MGVCSFKSLVGAQCDRLPALAPFFVDHQQRRISLGVSIGFGQIGSHDQATAIFHQRVPQITQPRLATGTFAVQLGVGVGLGLVSLIAALVAVKVFSIFGPTIFALKTLLRGPGFDQRAIHREVLIGQVRLRYFQYPLEEALGNGVLQQPVAVLGEHRAAMQKGRCRPSAFGM